MATTYLYRIFNTTATSTSITTFSFWVKRSRTATREKIIGAYADAGTGGAYCEFQADDTFSYLNGSSQRNTTNMLFRDLSGWYHICVRVNTGGSGASNQVRIEVNGVLQSLSLNQGASSPKQIANNNGAYDGRTVISGEESGWASQFFSGSMSHFHCIDGTEYSASTFGSTDATTGEWNINTSPTVTMGTNGFTILKDGNTITDQSSNSNDFTLGAGTLTNTEDCPSDVFATLNPLYLYGTTSNAYNNGNTAFNTTTTAWGSTFSTLGMTKGKFYAEMKVVNLVTNNGYMNLGIQGLDLIGSSGNTNANFVANSGSAGMEMDYRGGNNNNLYSGGGSQLQDTGVDWTNGDIVGLAVDMDNKGFYIHKNGTYLTVGSVGDPTSGATKTGAITIPASITTCGFAIGGYTDHAKGAFNFGNGYFGTTAISSAGTNASGIGIFEYDVPTGYTALSTKGLNS